MKFDTIIIGGGLSGLMAGVRLTQGGQKVAIITSGQSALHFLSGSFGLLGKKDGKEVANPIEAIKDLPATHPYSKVGADNIKGLADKTKEIFKEAGLTVKGSAERNHHFLTSVGNSEPTWLTMNDFAIAEDGADRPYKRVAIVNFKGYLDFYPEFISNGLRKRGVATECYTVTLPVLERLRKNTSEMRAATIAKVLTGDHISELADQINKYTANADAVLMPAVVGLGSEKPFTQLQRLVVKPLHCVAVLPMSVSGLRAQRRLRDLFERQGGTYLLGDSVTKGVAEGGKLTAVETANLAPTQLQADNYILATGSFFSQGIIAEPTRIYEPVFGVDLVYPADRGEWFGKDLLAEQPFMQYGVDTNDKFQTKKDGRVIPNLYAIGAILAGSNPIHEGSGGGIAIMTALSVAEQILKSSK